MNIRPIIHIGKDDLTNNVVIALDNTFLSHELIKISVLKTASTSLKELALSLSKATNSEIIQIIGKNIILYKKAKEPVIKL